MGDMVKRLHASPCLPLCFVRLLAFVQDYCRAVQPADIQLLLPQFTSLSEDPAFTLPALGCNPTHSGQDDEDGRDHPHANGNCTDGHAHSTVRNVCFRRYLSWPVHRQIMKAVRTVSTRRFPQTLVLAGHTSTEQFVGQQEGNTQGGEAARAATH